MEQLTNEAQTNYIILRDYLCSPLIRSATNPRNNGRLKRHKAGRKTAIAPSNVNAGPMPEVDAGVAEDLADFIDVTFISIDTQGVHR